MSYTLGEAARATGKNRSTINRAIHMGKISAKKNPDGNWSIDPTELFCIYPPASKTKDDKSNKGLRQISDGLKRENALLWERLQDKDELIKELRDERDYWKQIAHK